MAKVECEISYHQTENDSGREQDEVSATCTRCGACESSWGHGERSLLRCLALLKANCRDPDGPHYYVPEGEDHSSHVRHTAHVPDACATVPKPHVGTPAVLNTAVVVDGGSLSVSVGSTGEGTAAVTLLRLSDLGGTEMRCGTDGEPTADATRVDIVVRGVDGARALRAALEFAVQILHERGIAKATDVERMLPWQDTIK